MVPESSDGAEMSATDSDVDVKMISDNEGKEEDDEGDNDSDKELQIAFKEGLLKSDGLNYVVEKKRPIINKKAELEAKTEEIRKKLPWLETLDTTVSNEHATEKAINDDFEREIIFYKQAEKAVQMAVPRLREMGVKVFRPADYYAEMVKSDQHMQKVRQRMADLQESKQKQEAIRRIREEKKFAVKVQKEVLERKQSEKKMLLEAASRHRKGMKSQLDLMLKNAKRLQEVEDGDNLRNKSQNFRQEKLRGRGDKKKFSRAARNRKFGFGGQKKRSKKNDEKSFEEIVTPVSLSRKLAGRHFGAHFRKAGKHRKRK